MKGNIAKALSFLLILFAAGFGYVYHRDHQGDVDQAYVKAKLGKPGVVVVDVRPAEVYNGEPPREGIPGGHIEGALNFPLVDLRKEGAIEALTKAGITKDIEVIVYCNTGRVAGEFINALAGDFGFDRTKLKNYRGSVTDWVKDPANALVSSDV